MITWYINFKSSSNPDRKCLQKRTIIVSIFWIDRSPWNGPNPVFTVIYKSALVIIHLFCRTYERKVSSIKYLKYNCFEGLGSEFFQSFRTLARMFGTEVRYMEVFSGKIRYKDQFIFYWNGNLDTFWPIKYESYWIFVPKVFEVVQNHV